MARFLGLLAISLGIAACAPSETVTQYGGADYKWQLQQIDGAAVNYAASLTLGDSGKVMGDGPCNSFLATQDAPYPWINIQVDVVEQIYCPDIDREEAFLTALQEMSLVEVSGPNMVMSNDAGREMVFSGLPTDVQSDQ
ncbi:META domain-containing protein [Shimia sp. R10_1]|uniref:META domain-containing protein n=1 Tax=Shimia sp. R10_1 TaxID=2821095 RepID=UPI001ADA5981|nr:META domain-containing protein [Shimia sp. R10_1]MBO9472967.1 META domain-containing protein [Shimia sp. R10_1]